MYATWNWLRPEEPEPLPRRCCFDELAARLSERLPCLQPLSHLNGTMPSTLFLAAMPGLLPTMMHFTDALLRGASQVVVINNPLAGALIVTSLFFPSAAVGYYGALGLLGGTLIAFLLGFDEHARASGLFGYNGLLVGMGLATFLARENEFDAGVALSSLLVGGLSSVMQLALGNAFVPTFKTPPFTLAFNFTMLLFLLATPHFRIASLQAASTPSPVTVDSSVAVDAGWLLRSALLSVGQVFLCESHTSGGLILAAMALSSRIAACAAYAGALGGCALALALGVESAQIGHGLWGYNSCLTAVATVVFFVPSPKGCVVGAIGVALTVIFEGALRTVTEPLQMPIGTLPFCMASLVLLLTQSSIAGFAVVPLSDVSTAEDHLFSARVHTTKAISGAPPLKDDADKTGDADREALDALDAQEKIHTAQRLVDRVHASVRLPRERELEEIVVVDEHASLGDSIHGASRVVAAGSMAAMRLQPGSSTPVRSRSQRVSRERSTTASRFKFAHLTPSPWLDVVYSSSALATATAVSAKLSADGSNHASSNHGSKNGSGHGQNAWCAGSMNGSGHGSKEGSGHGQNAWCADSMDGSGHGSGHGSENGSGHSRFAKKLSVLLEKIETEPDGSFKRLAHPDEEPLDELSSTRYRPPQPTFAHETERREALIIAPRSRRTSKEQGPRSRRTSKEQGPRSRRISNEANGSSNYPHSRCASKV